MELQLPIVLSIISCLVAVMAFMRNSKQDTKQDAGQMMEIIVKLETINENVKEVKSDMKDVKNDMEKVKERLVIVEQATKSAHHRIDMIRDHKEDEHETD